MLTDQLFCKETKKLMLKKRKNERFGECFFTSKDTNFESHVYKATELAVTYFSKNQLLQ